MDAHTAEITIKLSLTEMRDRLERAVSIARAAQACADAGNVEKGIESRSRQGVGPRGEHLS